jgi:hypothetical protein
MGMFSKDEQGFEGEALMSAGEVKLLEQEVQRLRAKVERYERTLRDIGMGTAAADGASHCLSRMARKALAEDEK